MNPGWRIGFVCCFSLACGRAATPGSSDVDSASASSAQNPAPASASCPTLKINFTQAAGCQNDGAVEFCVTSNNPSVEATLRAIAPTLVKETAGSGRAGCDAAVLGRYTLPTPGLEPAVCIQYHGGMTDEIWAQVCQLAAVPEVQTIVPTFYE